jgi:predicted Rossmann fold flavoprotein
MSHHDVIIIGAGAAGLMCAIEAGKRGRRVLVLDHSNKPGKKILLSGGGRCNFTNRHASPANFLSNNPHFCISALKRYSQHDFEAMVQRYKIPYHEKTLGQLFCDDSAKDILNMLLTECEKANVEIKLSTHIETIEKREQFYLTTSQGKVTSDSLVIATGGLSFPTMGASPFGYKVAEQFGLNVLPVRAGLVPLTLHEKDLEKLAALSGVSQEVIATSSNKDFSEAMLFTHRGLSGPAILQISSYWQPGTWIHINLLPHLNVVDYLQEKQISRPKVELKTLLGELLSKRLAEILCEHWLLNKPINQYTHKELNDVVAALENWPIQPNGTEGYRTAEVTLGGVDTNEISSKTFESKKVPGLFFIGEVLDVTGHLGGFNFQWAWSSGFCCGQFT